MRLAIVTTHPIQYYAPWFRWMSENSEIDLKVFYLWDFGVTEKRDPGFGREVKWDLPLLEGYDHEFVPNTSSRPGTNHYFGIRNPELATKLKNWEPDAALLIGYKYASLMRLIFTPATMRGFPLLFRGDSHRFGKMRNSKFEIRNWIISQVYRRFEAFLYVGKANREYLRRHGVPERKLFFSPHVVDNERWMSSPDTVEEEAKRWRNELGILTDHALILFAGKFEQKKRPLDLLDAFIGSKLENVALLFVGNGALEAELRSRAANHANIFVAPFQNQTEMPRTYAACDLFVLPSFGAEESWGLAINEALCLSRPVIVSDHVGCGPDLVKHGENGLIFPAGDVQALAAALEEALRDRDRLKTWGLRGREIVSGYNFAAATRGLIQALDSIRKVGR